MQKNNQTIFYLLIAFCLFGYIVPWVIVPTSPLTLGAYDLAEWTTLHPSQPGSSPALIVALLLRLQLVIITLLLGLIAQTNTAKVISFIGIIILSIAQLPPLEILTSASGNINYQQQLTFAGISFFVGLILIRFKPTRFVPFIIIGMVSIGVISAIMGLSEAQKLYTASLQEHTLGMGIFIFVGCYLLIGLMSLRGLDIKLPINNREQTAQIKQGST